LAQGAHRSPLPQISCVGAGWPCIRVGPRRVQATAHLVAQAMVHPVAQAQAMVDLLQIMAARPLASMADRLHRTMAAHRLVVHLVVQAMAALHLAMAALHLAALDMVVLLRPVAGQVDLRRVTMAAHHQTMELHKGRLMVSSPLAETEEKVEEEVSSSKRPWRSSLRQRLRSSQTSRGARTVLLRCT